MPPAMLSPSASRSLASRRAASLSGRGVVPAAASRARAAPRPARASPGATRAEFAKLASVLAKKTQGDLDRVFKGTSTRERLGYMDEVSRCGA